MLDEIIFIDDLFTLHKLADYAVERAVQAEVDIHSCPFEEFDSGYRAAMIDIVVECLGCDKKDIEHIVADKAKKRMKRMEW